MRATPYPATACPAPKTLSIAATLDNRRRSGINALVSLATLRSRRVAKLPPFDYGLFRLV